MIVASVTRQRRRGNVEERMQFNWIDGVVLVTYFVSMLALSCTFFAVLWWLTRIGA